jgi:hypothetical protein
MLAALEMERGHLALICGTRGHVLVASIDLCWIDVSIYEFISILYHGIMVIASFVPMDEIRQQWYDSYILYN